MSQPNFLIVGAAKSATTSLYNYLKQHPQIFMPERKEPHFFTQPPELMGIWRSYSENRDFREYPVSESNYFSLFQELDTDQYKAIGEASVSYLYFHQYTIPLIKQKLGNPKIIIALRNPIYRAFSNYLLLRREYREKYNFKDAINQEEKRARKGLHWLYQYTDIGLYSGQVRAFLEAFPQVQIVIYDEFQKQPMEVLQSLHAFLGVDKDFVPQTGVKHNVSGVPKSHLIHKFFKKKNIVKSIIQPVYHSLVPQKTRKQIFQKIQAQYLKKPEMDTETRNHLRKLYKDDIKELSKLIDQDLTYWVK